jgi:type VI secretion system protein ImpL
MKRSTKTWLIALGVFAAYVVVAVILAFALRLHGAKLWQLIIAFVLFGLISAGILLWFMRDTLREPKPGTPASGIDAILAAARAALVSKRGGGATPNFGAMPALLVIGPQGSTKTTTVVRSGLEPELLAGDVFRGETVAPTAGANLWFTQNTLVVEAGGPLTNDVPAWQRLVSSLRPKSLLAALTGKPQAPRLAVVCFACDEFYKAGSGETVPAAARAIRSRLGEAAKQFGVPLPTYVVFTKLDSVPHFDAYTRNFSNDEARDPLGAAMMPDEGGAGTYADRMTPRLEHAFGRLYASLAERRLVALAREHAAEFKPNAYEFPREFNKLQPLAVHFLREIGRPSELEMSPVLRGFYFTGVQAVFVTQVTPEYTPPAAHAQMAGVRNATAVMGALGAAPAAAAAAPQPAAAGGRKVPRWDFLPRIAREVVFSDQAAVRLTSAGARVSFWRRLGLGVGTVVGIFFAIAFMWSYGGNKDLQNSALAATRGIASLAPNAVDIPPLDALRKLDALRTQVDTLSVYEHDGAPAGLGWGLYAGSALYPEVRTAYFASFNKLMFANTQAAMLASLRALPETPTPADDYGATYSLLKAYIITTTHPEKSTPDFLAPVLMTRWLAERGIDSARAPLARRQFETYANELRYANPFPATADIAAVGKARSFLRQFAGSERIYQFMLAEAGKTNPPVQFNRNVAGSAPYVVVSHEVPGAFTKGGATFMLAAFKTVDKYISGESWVVGEDAGGVDKAKLVSEFQNRYAADYATEWRKYLASAQVARYSGVKDAAAKLVVLSGNQSPLLALFSIASQNTNIPLPAVANVFQPVQLLTPPTVTDKLIGDKNGPYVNALLALQSSLDQVANAQGPAAEQAFGQASANASAAHTAARQIAAGFNIDQQGQVHSMVQNLMEAPIAYVEPMLKAFGSTEINLRGRSFCSSAGGTLAKFPFSPDASQQATLQEVTALLKPGSGSLWRFYDDALAAAVPRQGNQFTANPGGAVKISPSFVTFLNRAAILADVLFKDNSPEPRLSFTVQPVAAEPFTSVTLTLDGEIVRSSTGGNVASIMIDWPRTARDVKLSAGAGGTEPFTVGPYTGPWALFQLFNNADDAWRPTAAGGYRVGWEVGTRAQRGAVTATSGARITLEVMNLGAGAQVLRRGFLSAPACGGDLAR